MIEALVAYRDASGETSVTSPRTSTTGISFGIVSGGGSSSGSSSDGDGSSGSSGRGSSSSSDNPAALSDCELLPHVDTFGSGPDYDAIVTRVETEQLPIDVR